MKPTTLFKAMLTQATLALLLLSVASAHALTISPARAELTGDKGETISDTFLLINDQDSEQTYYTSVENFESQGESGTPNFTASKEGLPSWVKVEQKITLKKGERVKVPYSISIPQSTESGGHFAAIFLSTVPPTTDQNQVSVGAKVGMLILLRVTGDVKESGGLLSFELKEGKKLITSLPITFVYRFKNDGNDRVNPEGDIAITNTFGGDVAHLDANKAKGNILPASVRRFEVKYGEEDAPDAAAPFFDHVKFQYNHFALGMYTASMKLSFGNKGVAETSLRYFVVPWQLLVVIGVVLLVVFIVLSFALKRYNQWIIKQARAAARK
jgi:hypothetical protein